MHGIIWQSKTWQNRPIQCCEVKMFRDKTLHRTWKIYCPGITILRGFSPLTFRLFWDLSNSTNISTNSQAAMLSQKVLSSDHSEENLRIHYSLSEIFTKSLILLLSFVVFIILLAQIIEMFKLWTSADIISWEQFWPWHGLNSFPRDGSARKARDCPDGNPTSS